MLPKRIDGPFSYAEVLTPNNTVQLSNIPSLLHAQTTGTLNVKFLSVASGTNTSHTVLQVTAGSVYKYRIDYLFEGSSANVVGLW